MSKHYAFKYINKGNIAVYEFIPTHKDYYIYADEYKIYHTNKEKNTEISYLNVKQEISFSKYTVYETKEDLIEAIRNECDFKISVIESGLK